VVEDSGPFRKFVCSTLGKRPELQIVGELSDGLEAVQKVEELQPDLIVLDIGLPSLNGIEVARRIRALSRQSRILFVSQEISTDVVQAAFATGAGGYVVKTDAGRELLEAVDTVLRGGQFVGCRFAGHDFAGAGADAGASQEFRTKGAFAPLHQNTEIGHCHDVGFYSDDAGLLDDLTQFIGAALKAGNAAIVVATESHRESLLPRLQAQGLDIRTAIDQGRYVTLDAADTLSALMLNGMPDQDRFLNFLGNLMTVSKAATGKQARVSIFGECVHLLCAQGNAEAAIQFEKLGNQLAKIYDVDILCGYSLGFSQDAMDSHIFQRICAEHSAVHSR